MELRQLRYFVAIARHGSFSRAAQVVCVAQSAISYQVARLEDDLDARLFHRMARGVALTDAGAAFLPRAVAILRQADDARASLRGTANSPSGKVVFGLSPSVCSALAIPLLQAVKQKLPQVELELTEELTSTLAMHLHSGDLDLAVLIDDGTLGQFTSIPILTERLCVISPGAALARHKRSITFKNALQLPLLLPAPRQGVRPLIESCAREQKLGLPNVVAEINSVVILRSSLLAGIGNTIQSSMAFRQDIDSGALIALLIERPRLTRTLALCTAKHVPTTSAVAAVQDVAIDLVHGLIRSKIWPDAVIEGSYS
jgi:LysR family nitrogen assimilation transcriptional regulator